MQIRQATFTAPNRPQSGTQLPSQETPRFQDTVEFGSRGDSQEAAFQALGRNFHKRQAEISGTRQVGNELFSSFPGREGYDSSFLGTDLALPKLSPALQEKAATLIDDPSKTELEYTNFSIVMNKERRQAFYSAVNIDGAQIVSRPRKGKWTIDSRIRREHQLGNEAYRHNPIDRGHMVRRRDPVWGPHAERANSDTFAYTNAGLQHGSLNQKTWLDLENYVLDQAKAKEQKLTVLTGPVFDESDPSFDNRGRMSKPTQIPQEFWKVVVWNDEDEGLKGAAFLQSQKDYLGSSLFQSEFDPDGMSVYQMPLKELEEKLDIDFGDLKDSVQSTRRITEASQPLL